jgi:hypothetical protein
VCIWIRAWSRYKVSGKEEKGESDEGEERGVVDTRGGIEEEGGLNTISTILRTTEMYNCCFWPREA